MSHAPWFAELLAVTLPAAESTYVKKAMRVETILASLEDSGMQRCAAIGT